MLVSRCVAGPAYASRLYLWKQVSKKSLMADVGHGLSTPVANLINAQNSSKWFRYFALRFVSSPHS